MTTDNFLDIPVSRDGNPHYEMYDATGNLISCGTLTEISKETGHAVHNLRRSSRGEEVKPLGGAEVIYVGKLYKVYKCYMWDKLVIIGTTEEVAYELGVTRKKVANYAYTTKLGRPKKFRVYDTGKTTLVDDPEDK